MSKTRTWGLLAVVVILAVVAAGWFFALSPQKSKVSKLHDSAAQQIQANQGLKSQIELLKKQQTQIPAQQAQIAKIQQRIPGTPAMTAYVRTLNALATKNKVDLVSVAPAAPAAVRVLGQTTATPATASPAVGAVTATAPAANLEAIQVSINVVGEYYNIQQFESSLEDATRATIVSSLELQAGQLPQPQGGPTSGTAPAATGASWTTLSATITASVFMSATPAASAAPGAVAAPPAANSGTK